jgi:hypothetical protein
VTVTIPLSAGLSLRMADLSSGRGDYPTARLQKGLLLLDDGEDLAEEGVGFGVPILKRGIRTIFPGDVKVTWDHEGELCTVRAAFAMNLLERLARPAGATVKSRSLYAAKNSLAALHRRSPTLRGPLTAASNALRRTFGWATTFEEAAAEDAATLTLTYTIDAGEVVVMNELGARHFDEYTDADGTSLRGDQIGSWDRVAAARASFVCAARRVSFSLEQTAGATLHRGRELIGSRVSWSGFGYSLPPTLERFGYDLTIERTS